MLSPEHQKSVLFPHASVRPVQDELVLSVERALEKKKHLVVHAPTGLGKTAATLGPAIAYAVQNDLTVFFLTSRHTQHRIALETVRAIEERHDVSIPVANLIGKKWMCLQHGVEKLRSGEFMEYCRKLRDDKACSYFENLKTSGSLSADARLAVDEAQQSPDSGQVRVIGERHKVCPYEIAVLSARKARVIVTDYFYLFNPGVRDVFLQKVGKDLSQSIVIVDEAHNLPDRIKDLASSRLSTRVLARARAEAEKWGEEFPELLALEAAINRLAEDVDSDEERYVTKQDLRKALSVTYDAEALRDAGDTIRAEQQRSYIGSVGDFLLEWDGADEGFARILTRYPDAAVLSYRCMDPGIVSGPVIKGTYSTILMSGTLTPTVMYAELLDVPLNAEEYTFRSPFPDEHRLTLVVPQTTTKYQARSDEMFAAQGRLLARMVDAVPGNSIVFFPSYSLRDKVVRTMQSLTSKPVFLEVQGMAKGDREEVLRKFSGYKDSGAVLAAVMSGSFAEGIDLPGDLLKGVFIVGLPLARPDKEAKALIEYYNQKFERGWDYGYVFPAFNRILQSAGRCIRSETDRGVICFVDERYAWRNYQRCFPPHWDLRMTDRPGEEIKSFFGVKSQGSQATLD